MEDQISDNRLSKGLLIKSPFSFFEVFSHFVMNKTECEPNLNLEEMSVRFKFGYEAKIGHTK